MRDLFCSRSQLLLISNLIRAASQCIALWNTGLPARKRERKKNWLLWISSVKVSSASQQTTGMAAVIYATHSYQNPRCFLDSLELQSIEATACTWKTLALPESRWHGPYFRGEVPDSFLLAPPSLDSGRPRGSQQERVNSLLLLTGEGTDGRPLHLTGLGLLKKLGK